MTLWLVGTAVVAGRTDLAALLVYTGASFLAFQPGEVRGYNLQV